ncbi:prepilin-type N-terminal cleavage/methylation domain-containing protein [Rheinheimera faecalis]|uniref:prepilin-type N-terminal cleavage/methylation domain-containing protein n=1 Tax=Rheinheimera faecalis TaxID=2901141 RepID=UPI0022B8462A|nr:prepilin-type N-terminal cleavage/methylation domain-containing protein [Rheinheimera faecalis]
MKTINKTQQGFTLVELIIVIVILGILAVTAAPRFLNLTGDARAATLDAVEASVISINNLVNGKARLQGVDVAAATATVTDGTLTINVAQGQPSTNNGDEVEWGSLLDSNDFTVAFNASIDETDGKFTAVAADQRDAILILPAGYSAPTAAADLGCYVYVVNYVDDNGTAGDTSDDVLRRELGKVTDGCN